MKIIKMIKGMTVINGRQYAVGDGAFQIDDEAKAARLVKLGVAEYADGAKLQESNTKVEKNIDVDSMTFDELKAKATELGIKYPGKKKTVLIEEIKAALTGNVETDTDNEGIEGDIENADYEGDVPTFSPEGNIQ